MISISDSRPAKSSGFLVYSGSWFASAVAAINRSGERAPRCFRLAATTALAIRPYARATLTSKGNGLKVASALWSCSWRRARTSGSLAAAGPAASSASVTAKI